MGVAGAFLLLVLWFLGRIGSPLDVGDDVTGNVGGDVNGNGSLQFESECPQCG